ncbi:MAG TPA: alpha-glucuronidase, partial [Gammaproteobacteria bacterium]|nr:alpha-glucuronidase [Gammaproteobacteria bacterium]
VPMEYLLWFHRLPWEHRLRSGTTLWQELVARYDRGVAEIDRMRASWADLEAHVDAERFAKTAAFLAIQSSEARWWRDACLAYFSNISGLPLPEGARAPEHSLQYYMKQSFPNAPGN